MGKVFEQWSQGGTSWRFEPGWRHLLKIFFINDFYFSFVRDRPLFFYWRGGYLFHKKLFASYSWLIKIVCFKVMN